MGIKEDLNTYFSGLNSGNSKIRRESYGNLRTFIENNRSRIRQLTMDETSEILENLISSVEIETKKQMSLKKVIITELTCRR